MRQDSKERQDRAQVADRGLPSGKNVASPTRVPQWIYPLLTVFSLALGAEAVVRGTRAITSISDSDLTNFFFKSAEYILRGDPWHMYAVRASAPLSTYPNFNPPLSMFLMAPLLGLAQAIGFAANYGEQITFVSLPFILLVPLLGYLVLRVLRFLFPEIPEAQRLLAFAVIVLSPLTWQSIATWYHLEQPLMLCFLVASLLALQQRRELLAGVLAGLAVLTRTTALMPLIAVGVLLLASGYWRGLLKLGVTGALVALAGVAPFFIVDRADAMYSFVSWRGTAIIGGNSIWSIFAYGGTAGGIRHALDAIARRLDMPSVVLFIVVVAFIAARQLRVSAYGPDMWAVAAIAALAVPMLSKTNWPYYYLEPFIPLLIWEFASMHTRVAGLWRWPVLSVMYLAVTLTLSQFIGLQSVGTIDRVFLGVLEFAAMLGFAIAIWRRMGAVKPMAPAIAQGASGRSSEVALRGAIGPDRTAERAGGANGYGNQPPVSPQWDTMPSYDSRQQGNRSWEGGSGGLSPRVPPGQ